MKRLVAILFLLGTISLRAQDIHFSQIDANPLLLNPAYAGFYDGMGRFGVIYRNQWASVSTPFQTFAVTGEIALLRHPAERSGLSLGLLAYNDVAGSLHYGTLSGTLSLTYYHAINRRKNSILSFGLEGGYGQQGFNPDRAEMDDPRETFDLQQVRYPLLGAGIAWYYQPNGSLLTRVGFAARNINRPNISYMHLDDTRLEPRFNIYARAEYRCWQSVALMPAMLFQFQKDYKEFTYGLNVKWFVMEEPQMQFSLSGGLALRQGDALIATLGMEYNALLFTFCYDANISQLANASHTIGAFELGLVYRLAKPSKKKTAIKCPTY